MNLNYVTYTNSCSNFWALRIFWDVTLHCWVKDSQYFEGMTRCNISQNENPKLHWSEKPYNWYFLLQITCLATALMQFQTLQARTGCNGIQVPAVTYIYMRYFTSEISMLHVHTKARMSCRIIGARSIKQAQQ